MCYLPLKKPIQRDATKDSVERGTRYEYWYDKYHSVLVFVVSPHLIILYSRNCSGNFLESLSNTYTISIFDIPIFRQFGKCAPGFLDYVARVPKWFI